MDFITIVLNACMKDFATEQLQKIKHALLVGLKDYDVVPRKTDLTIPGSELNERFLSMFLVSMKIDGKSQVTMDHYIESTRKFLDFVNKRCVDVTSNDILLYIAKLQQTPNLADNTVFNYYKSIKPFWAWLTENEFILKNPFAKVHFTIHTEPPKEVLTPEELVKVRDSCTNKLDLALVDFLSSTGLRVGELRSLNKSDVDFQSYSVSVYAHKTKTWRTVFMTPSAAKHLKDYLEIRKDSNEALFVGKQGIRMSDRCIELRLRAVAKQAGINKHMTVHLFRRTLATMLHAKGMNDIDIAAIMGHSKIDTTIKYYIKNDIGGLKNSFARCLA